jgi:hypothetical protein
MTTTAATQENKVTRGTIITPAEIREGDRIKVTVVDGDRINTHEGVANHFKLSGVDRKRRWFTADDWTLWTAGDGAVIELLDRPEPKIVLPSKNLAIVHYQYTPYTGATPDARTAVRDAQGKWTAYGSDGFRMNCFVSDDDFSEYLGSDYANELVVAFGGTK